MKAAICQPQMGKEAVSYTHLDVYKRQGLLVAAAVGVLVAMRAPISGAIGGCQSEIGVASAMTAAGLEQLGGGTPEKDVYKRQELRHRNTLRQILRQPV